MLFGQFLIERDVATEEEVLRALDDQRKNRLPLGTVAVMAKFLTIKDVYTILNSQVSEPGKNFGEIAQELGLLNREELDKILSLQKEQNPHVGEVLVEHGVLDREKLLEEINAFVRVQEADVSKRFYHS